MSPVPLDKGSNIPVFPLPQLDNTLLSPSLNLYLILRSFQKLFCSVPSESFLHDLNGKNYILLFSFVAVISKIKDLPPWTLKIVGMVSLSPPCPIKRVIHPFSQNNPPSSCPYSFILYRLGSFCFAFETFHAFLISYYYPLFFFFYYCFSSFFPV